MEHAVTKDKMKDLMAKFKKGKEFRQDPPPLPNQSPPGGGQYSRKGTGKVLILESRAPSRILHNSSSRVTPLPSTHSNESRLPQRKLVFPGDSPCSRLHHTEKPRKRMTSCSLSSRKMRSPSDETPIVARTACSRVRCELGCHCALFKYFIRSMKNQVNRQIFPPARSEVLGLTGCLLVTVSWSHILICYQHLQNVSTKPTCPARTGGSPANADGRAVTLSPTPL